MSDIKKAKEILSAQNRSCVFVKGDSTYSEDGMGVLPIIKILDENEDLIKSSVADKVVGRAAALLFALIGVKEVYGEIMSKSAMEILTMYGIEYSFATEVEGIMNRAENDICPLEKLVTQIDQPVLAFREITRWIEEKKSA